MKTLNLVANIVLSILLAACQPNAEQDLSASGLPEAALTRTASVAQEQAAAPGEQQAVPAGDDPDTSLDSPVSPTVSIPAEITVKLDHPYNDIGMDVLAQINQWRIQQGVWPLLPNAELDQLAIGQAEYIASLSSVPNDYHAGPGGSQPQDRALAAGWPFYNKPNQIAVTEIAYSGASAAAAMAWWTKSSLHNQSMSSTTYREVGIDVVPDGGSYVFIVVFASRPEVLPTLYDPHTRDLYLSSERYKWARGARIQDVNRYQILPTVDTGITERDWRPWRSSINLPMDLREGMAVAYTDGMYNIISEIDLSTHVAWLPGNLDATSITVVNTAAVALPQEAAEIKPTATFTPTATPLPTATPIPSSTPIPTATAAADDATPEDATRALAATSTPRPTADPVSNEDMQNITLIYGRISLAIINSAPGERLDLTGLEFVGADTTLPISAWDTEWLGVPLDSFSVGSCLQTWNFAFDDPGEPFGCNLRASVIHIGADPPFWTRADFDVVRNGTTLATCSQAVATGFTTCEVDLQ